MRERAIDAHARRIAGLPTIARRTLRLHRTIPLPPSIAAVHTLRTAGEAHLPRVPTAARAFATGIHRMWPWRVATASSRISHPCHGLSGPPPTPPFLLRPSLADADFNLLKFPDRAQAMEKITDLTLLSDIFPTGFHGAVMAKVGPGSVVYVAGAGPVGLACAASCHLLGAACVIVGDAIPERLEQARSFGCETLDIRTDGTIEEKIHAITGALRTSPTLHMRSRRLHHGATHARLMRVTAHAGSITVDAAVDCVGFEARGMGADSSGEVPAQVLNDCMTIVREGGQIGIPGLVRATRIVVAPRPDERSDLGLAPTPAPACYPFASLLPSPPHHLAARAPLLCCCVCLDFLGRHRSALPVCDRRPRGGGRRRQVWQLVDAVRLGMVKERFDAFGVMGRCSDVAPFCVPDRTAHSPCPLPVGIVCSEGPSLVPMACRQCPVMKYHRPLMNAILYDKIQIAKAVNAQVISLDDAPKGYTNFDQGASVKYVIDPHGATGLTQAL